MSYDIEHKLIYEECCEPVILFGDKVIGKRAIRIYQEDDGSFSVTSATEACDLDPRDFQQVRLSAAMLAKIDEARVTPASPSRAEMIEECAKVAEGKFDVDGNDSSTEVTRWMAGRDIAKAIRALASKPDGEK